MKQVEKKIAVLMGGPSDEHDVSMRSGQQVLQALGTDDTVAVVIGKDGLLRTEGELPRPVASGLELLAPRIDVAFIALHGPFGEDGMVQALLEASGIPYTGSGVLASALAMDKVRSKAIYRASGLPTAESFSVPSRDPSRNERMEHVFERVPTSFGFPCVVKPATLGSSFGLAIVRDEAELRAHVEKLSRLGHDVLVERYIRGRELTCGVLDFEREARTQALPVTEIVPGAKYTFFDYEAKYTPGASEEITPARIPDEVAAEVQRLAREAHRALGCTDMSRTDFIRDGNGALFLLETNTIPGFTATSLLPQGARAAGIEFGDLCRLLVDNARMRGPRRALVVAG